MVNYNAGEFRAICTSPDRLVPTHEFFDSEQFADEWSRGAIKKAQYEQIVIEQKTDDGWQVVRSYKA